MRSSQFLTLNCENQGRSPICEFVGRQICPFSFFELRFGNFLEIYLKHSLSLFSALTYCFIRPSLICKGGNMIRFRSTRGTFITLRLPGTSASLEGHYFLVQCSHLVLLSHKHIKKGYLVQPPCCPKRKLTILRSTQITHLCSLYFILFKTNAIVGYSSLTLVECAIGREPSLFPLCNSTHFKLRFDESINKRYSFVSYLCKPMAVIKPEISVQYTKSSSSAKKGSKTFARVR